MARIGNLIRDPAELKKRSGELDKLSTMLDRITKKDIQDAAQAILDCSHDLQYLLTNTPVGCPCRIISDENYAQLLYEDDCVHHGRFKRELARMKASYEDAERKLTETLRTEFAKAALVGIEYSASASPADVAKRAYQVADAMIAALSKPS